MRMIFIVVTSLCVLVTLTQRVMNPPSPDTVRRYDSSDSVNPADFRGPSDEAQGSDDDLRESFVEHLSVVDLPGSLDGTFDAEGPKLALLSFSFETVARLGGSQEQDAEAVCSRAGTGRLRQENLHLLPKRLFQVFEKSVVRGEASRSPARLRRLQLSFGKGRWFYDEWGNMPRSQVGPFPDVIVAPSGATVVADWDELPPGADARSAWNDLTHGLSGLFCASLNQLSMEEINYASGVTREEKVQGSGVQISGRLSRESVCTENLMAIRRLVPGLGMFGLAKHLRPVALLSKHHYHALAVTVERRRRGTSEELVVVLQVNVVTELPSGSSSSSKKKGGIKLLSDMVLSKKHSTATFEPNPMGRSYVVASCAGDVRWSAIGYDGNPSSPLLCRDGWNVVELLDGVVADMLRVDGGRVPEDVVEFEPSLPVRSSIVARKMQQQESLYGFKGHLLLAIANVSPRPIRVTLTEVVPWFLTFEYHTLDLSDHFYFFDNSSSSSSSSVSPSPRSRIQLTPGPHGVAMRIADLEIGPDEVATLKGTYKKAFISVFAHPPDPNRGFDWPGAVVEYCDGGDGDDKDEDDKMCFEIHTEALLVPMPLPDFSMPFNVIMLSSTAVSLFFGAVLVALVARRNWAAKLRLARAMKEVCGELPASAASEERDDDDDDGTESEGSEKEEGEEEDEDVRFRTDFDLSQHPSFLMSLLRSFFAQRADVANKRPSAKRDFEVRFSSSWSTLIDFLDHVLNKTVKFVAKWKKGVAAGDDPEADLALLDPTRRVMVDIVSSRWEDLPAKASKSKLSFVLGSLKGLVGVVVSRVLSLLSLIPGLDFRTSKFDAFVASHKDELHDCLEGDSN